MSDLLVLSVCAGAARLPGFHTCVGGGGERQEGAWYAGKGITYLTATRVVSVDVAGKSLTLQSGSVINWEKLVIATGADVGMLARRSCSCDMLACGRLGVL